MTAEEKSKIISNLRLKVLAYKVADSLYNQALELIEELEAENEELKARLKNKEE